MPFGLMNAPISFQTLMSGVLRELSFKSVLVYIDDVLIYSRDFDSHLKDLSLVFQKLRQAGLTLEPSKCHFAVKQLKFLGHVISKNGVEVDQEKPELSVNFQYHGNRNKFAASWEWRITIDGLFKTFRKLPLHSMLFWKRTFLLSGQNPVKTPSTNWKMLCFLHLFFPTLTPWRNLFSLAMLATLQSAITWVRCPPITRKM